MVWRQDAETMESRAGFERIFGGPGLGDGGGLRGFQHRFGDAGVDFFALDAFRLHCVRRTCVFVPRTGAMALPCSMDQLGPICRSVEDCALVMSAICRPDGKDRTV